jgi:hypothetical protein
MQAPNASFDTCMHAPDKNVRNNNFTGRKGHDTLSQHKAQTTVLFVLLVVI